MILEFAKQCNYGCVCLHNNRPTLTHQGAPVLAFNILSDHTYFYKSQSVAKQILKWGGGVKEVLKRKHCRTRVWIRPGQLPETLVSASGNFFCQEEDVTSIRQQLLLLDIVPKITLKDESRIKSMSYKRCRIEVLPPNWQQIDQWCSKLGVVYSGQSLPTASFEVLSSLIKELNVRETLSGEEKTASWNATSTNARTAEPRPDVLNSITL